MKKLLVAAVTSVVSLGLVTATGSAATASVATRHNAPATFHGSPGHHQQHKGHHRHKPYPGTVKTFPGAFYSPWLPAGGSAYVVGSVYPAFAAGSLKLSVTGEGYSKSKTGHFLVAGPLKAGYYTVTASFTPKPGSVYAPSSASYPLFVFPSKHKH